MKKVIYSALYQDDCKPFAKLASDVDVVREPDELKELDSYLVVWGGQDIHPDYYRHPMHTTTHPGGYRDKAEWSLMTAAAERGIPIIGVCRGAQMACALAGGWLIQDVRGHHGHHFAHTYDGKVLTVNSIHHQMQAGLEKVDHELVAWAEGHAGKPYGYKDNQVWEAPTGWREPEFVYYPKIRAYAIQWHPEMMARDHLSNQYVLDYITKKEKQESATYAAVTL